MRAELAFNLLLERHRFDSVLDVGPGDGEHARAFRAAGKRVAVVDLTPLTWPDASEFPQFIGDFVTTPIEGRFDCIWASHVLEHSAEPQRFLRRIHEVVSPGGVIAVTVPPRKDKIVPGHLTLWNPGLLLYHLILAGFDCRGASVAHYGYNCSVVMAYRPLADRPIHWQQSCRLFPAGIDGDEKGIFGHLGMRRINW